jgi:peptide/nickel transport system permease protein
VRRFVLARAFQALIVVAVVATGVFALARAAPGDPFWAIDDPYLTAADRDALRHQWGFDDPLLRQYARWLGNFATGDFGWSHSRSRPVSAVLREAVPNTLLLAIPSLLAGLAAGLAMGTWKAARRGRPLARVGDALTLALASVPDFVVALVMASVFAVWLGVAPVSGIVDPVMHDSLSFAGRVGDVLAHLALPGATLALVVAASLSRYHRAAVVSVLGSDHLRTARARGMSERRVLFRYALLSASGPMIAVLGLLLPALFAGTVFIEKVFGWPGMGLVAVDAVAGRDYPLVQAVVIVGTLIVVTASALADVAAAWLNPRTRADA